MRIGPFLIAAMLLTAAHDARAEAVTSPGSAPLVNDPCGIVPPDKRCLPATFVAPTQDQTIVGDADGKFTFRGVAERDREVGIYFLRSNGAPVNALPNIVTADTDGGFEYSVALGHFDQGTHRVVAYYLSTMPDPERVDSFFQMTGVPDTTFIVGSPSPAVTTPPPTDERCGFNLIIDSPQGKLGRKTSTSFGNAFFLLHPRDQGSAPPASLVRTWIHNQIFTEVKKGVCRYSQTAGIAENDVARIRDPLNRYEGMSSVGLKDLRLIGLPNREGNTSQFHYTIDQISDRVNERLANGCSYASDAVADEKFLPAGTGRNEVQSMFKNACALTGCTNPDFTPSDACPYEVLYQSGNSPLVFLSSDRPVEARVDVRAEVTYSAPLLPSDGWRASVRPDATTLPLYYEFTAPLPALPSEGWSVATGDLPGFLRTELASWGYPADEVEAFLRTDVAPKLPEAPFVQVRVYAREDVDRMLPLDVTPTPDRVDRVLFHLQPSPQDAVLVPPAAQPRAGVAGFTVRELGAVIGR